MNKHQPLSSRERAARWRAAMREKGYRPKTIWVPDLRRPEVRERLQREAEAIAKNPHDADDQAFIDSLVDWDDLPPYDAPIE